MTGSTVRLYKLVRWNEAFGEWPVYPDIVEEVIRDVSVSHSYSEKACPFMLVNLLLEGELAYSCGDETHCVVGTGGVFVIPPGSDYSFSSTQPKRYRKLVLGLRGHLLPSLCDALQLARPFQMKAESLEGIEKTVRELGSLLRAGQEESLPAIQSKLHGILAELSLAARAVPDAGMRLLARAKSRLEGNSGEATGIAELASELGVSYSMLNKLFRKELGLSPQRYRAKRRVEEAMRLLSHTSFPVKEISTRLGYASQLYFSNDFKRHCGVSPSEYRRLNQA